VPVKKIIHSKTKRPLTVRRLSVIEKKTDATIEGIINCAQYH